MHLASDARALNHLSTYHPIIIEGMGGYDSREPEAVTEWVVSGLNQHWHAHPTGKPKLLIIQGDPLEPRGISAITARVAKRLGINRGLVCLDEAIADYHARDADRDNVIIECRYSQLAAALDAHNAGALSRIETQIDRHLNDKNAQRHALGKPPLKDYFSDFARLQEVTKAACQAICGEITVAHTANEIHPFSVTSFYTVTRDLGLIDASDSVNSLSFLQTQ